MEKKKFVRLVQTGVSVLCIGFLIVASGTALAAPKGNVALATYQAQGMTGFDIHTGSGSHHGTALSLVHAKLIEKDVKGNYGPDLATSWEIGPQWSFVKFYMNKNAKFHDGKPITAEDVKFTIERAMKSKYLWKSELNRNVKKVEVVDKHTVIIHMKAAYPAIMDRCSFYYGIVPKHYIDKVGNKTFAEKAIGGGPFKLVRYKQGVFAEVTANTDHYRKVPNIKNFRLLHVKEGATRSAMLKTGEIDIAQLDPGTFWEMNNVPGIRVEWARDCYLSTLSFYDLAFPDTPSPIHDIRVRKALALGVDRKTICEKVLKGGATPQGDVLAPYNPGFDPSIKPTPYDPEKARALLKEAGYPNGFEISMTCIPSSKMEAEAIAAGFSKIGVKVKLNIPETMIWSRMVRNKKFKGIARDSGPYWNGRGHPASSMWSYTYSTSVWCFVGTPEVDKRLGELAKLSDKKEIAAAAADFSKYYRSILTRSPLWSVHRPHGLRDRIKSFKWPPGWSAPTHFEYLVLND
ncbi:ABC transporter substrate-binding protein [Thermodesulfobacteriota bacterium]